MSEGGAPSGVNSAMLESMRQSESNFHSGASVGESGGAGIISGSLDQTISMGSISIGLEGSDISNSGLLAKMKDAAFMEKAITESVNAMSTTLAPVQNVGQHVSDLQMQPFAGHNFAPGHELSKVPEVSALGGAAKE